MRNKTKALCSIVCMLLLSTVLHAQDSGWSVNPHDYQYDMTVYGSLVVDDIAVTDFENYDIAAFVGEECRGVAEVMAKDGYTWLYLRVRSNVASGETVTFKVYNKAEGKAYNIVETMAFASNGLEGMPSAPITLTLRRYTLGDVNDDGIISVADITSILSIMAGNVKPNYVLDAADANEDGRTSVADITRVLSIMAGN